MGMGKYALYGLGGFFAIGVAVKPFIPEPSPERDMEMGKKYFANQCEGVTRNRKINGSFGKGHKYCACLADRVSEVAETGDEFRFAERIHDSVATERWFFAKSRAKINMDVGIREFEDKIDRSRMRQLFLDVVDRAKSCSRAV